MISKQFLLSAALSAVLTVPLGGCFFADPTVPLLTTEAADFPFTRMVVEDEENGERLTLARESGSYVPVGVKPEESFTSLVKRAGDDTFVVQTTWTTPIFAKIGYGIFKYRENEIEAYYCGNYSLATIQSIGIQAIKNPPGIVMRLCAFSSLTQLLTLSMKRPDGEDPVKKIKVVSIDK